MDPKLQKIYQDWKTKAINAGFTFEEFWCAVLAYIKDELNTDSASWAIAAELAYNDLEYYRSM